MEVYKKQTVEDSLEQNINLLHKSLMEFKKDFTSKFESFEKKYPVNAKRSNNSIEKQPDIASNIDSKLT